MIVAGVGALGLTPRHSRCLVGVSAGGATSSTNARSFLLHAVKFLVAKNDIVSAQAALVANIQISSTYAYLYVFCTAISCSSRFAAPIPSRCRMRSSNTFPPNMTSALICSQRICSLLTVCEQKLSTSRNPTSAVSVDW